jgi:hypothetical protein
LSRYSSFGRHFSRTQLLQAVAEILEHFLRPNDVVVDYSCGANEFVPLVKRWAHRAGFKVGGCPVMLFSRPTAGCLPVCVKHRSNTG